MALEKVLEMKYIKDRKKFLSNFLKNNPIGQLNLENEKSFIKIFDKYYTTDFEEFKLKIKYVEIVRTEFNNKCFFINKKYNCSIQKLAGSKMKRNFLTISMRNSISEQITNFKELNVLDENALCPILKCRLGDDAQIDHKIPFHILKDNWIKTNIGKNAKFFYSKDKKQYILEAEYFKDWNDYHFNNCVLRWTSKEGNKIAHLNY